MIFTRITCSTLARPSTKNQKNGWARSPLSVAVALVSALAACSNDGDSPGMAADGSTSIPAGRFAVAMNDSQSSGNVFVYSPDLATMDRVLVTGANQGLAVGSDGTLYQNGDGAGDAGIRAMNRATDRADMDSFGAGDRIIGSASGKGLFTLPDKGLLASCDVTDEQADLKFYASTAGEQARAVSSIDLPVSCWDGFYSESESRLYLALTNGSLAVIDEMNLLDLRASTTDTPFGDEILDRIITVVDRNGVQQSVNFHGVSAENGMVLVSDIGTADSSTDGALYLFSDDGTLDGGVSLPRVSGPATMLGNPVDVLLIDGTAIVAEKSNNAILVFNAIFGRSGNVTPDYQVAFTKPQSIAALRTDEVFQGTSETVSDSSLAGQMWR